MSAESSLLTVLTSFKSRLRLGALILASAVSALAVGCSGNTHVPVYPVRGQVLLNGKPLAEAIVTFHLQSGAAEETFPSAHTDADGRFALTSYETGDGAPAGAYGISLVCFRARPIRKGYDSDAVNVVPQRYANIATSKLTATVVPGDNELPPFQVKNP
jgi:hypothetical protein